MAKCCGASGCTCAVTAGPGVTVDGNGSPTNPYIVSSAAGEPTALQAADTPTVDTNITGSGTGADPYEVSANVILDPAPPGGGANLLEAGPDGLYVECADVRTCLTAGDGIAYDQATGEIAARPSTDAGNLVTFGTDGGLLATAPAAAPTAVEGGDTPTANNTVTGTGAPADPYVVTTDVILDPAPPGGGANLLEAGPDGLYVECADIRTCFSAGDGAAYDPGTGEISARVSADAGNTVTIGGDGGLYAAGGGGAPSVVTAGDTPTVNATVAGSGAGGDPYVVSADVILDPAPPGGGANLLEAGPDGLYVECADVRTCLTAGTGIAYDPATGTISATGGGGDPLVTADSTCIALTGDGTAGAPLTAAPILDPAPGNALTCGPDGLLVTPGAVSCDDVRPCLSAGDGIAYDPGTGEISARPSADAGNTLEFGSDGGLHVPAAEALETACGLTGDGTTGAPLAASVGTWAYPCTLDDNAGQVYCDSTGQLRGEPRSYATFVQDQQVLNPANLTVPTPQDTEVASHTLVITNPDPCRPAFVMVEGEADADFNLPPGSGAALGITTDEMSYVANNGTTTLLDVHIQGTKVVNTTIPPGGSINFTIAITMGRGSGGATYNRIQSYLRAFVFVL